MIFIKFSRQPVSGMQEFVGFELDKQTGDYNPDNLFCRQVGSLAGQFVVFL